MPWTQVVVLRSCVAAHKKATGDSDATLAEKLGTTPKTLKFWQSGARSPKRANLQRMAEVFGISITRLMDDPGQEIAGHSTAHLSEKKRFLAGLMFEGITADDMTDDDAQLLYEDYLSNRARLQALKARVKPSEGG